MESWTDDLTFERIAPLRRVLKATVINPLANYMPATLTRTMLRLAKSELAASNWKDPGGWRSMVISYDGNPRQIADKILVNAGTMSMALRNRRILAARLLARLINDSPSNPVEVLCLGAGPGRIITDALLQSPREARATLVDLSSDAFEYGQALARRHGLEAKVRFIKGDVRDVQKMLDRAPDLVKMLGICEYLSDAHLGGILTAVAGQMTAASPIVFNSLSLAHGTDRFFRRVFGLHMIHRSPAQLQDIFAKAGFTNFEAHCEPLGVYHVIIGRKA